MIDTRPMFGVDFGWSSYSNRRNQDGGTYPSKVTKFHVDRGDSTALCSQRILLNALPGDVPAGTVEELMTDYPSRVCSKCRRIGTSREPIG
jgi:hypothetical protein